MPYNATVQELQNSRDRTDFIRPILSYIPIVAEGFTFVRATLALQIKLSFQSIVGAVLEIETQLTGRGA